MTGRGGATAGDVAPILAAAFGSNRRLSKLTRLPGASKKGVYRATFTDESTAILYLWAEGEDYWPTSGQDRDPADPFSHASGLGLFQAARRRLDELGVPTPRLHFADGSRELYPADIAVVEDVAGPTLGQLLDRNHQKARPAVSQLGDYLRAMHADTAPRFGKLPYVSTGGISRGGDCAQVVTERAVRDLDECSMRDHRIGRLRDELASMLREQHAAVNPRPDYSLIHGELDPDHVLVDRRGRPVIIDIEGLMYFDAEWEHVFLQLRFGDAYPLLRASDLDPPRMRLYRLALHLSLVAGPLRLLDGDYPEREMMAEIAEYNLGQVLALAGHGRE